MMNLKEYNKNSTFTTPEGYFEALDRNIGAATCRRQKTAMRRSLLSRVAGIMSYAAMIAVIAFVGAQFITGREQEKENVIFAFEEFDENDIIDRMLDSYPIDEYTFYSYMTGN